MIAEYEISISVKGTIDEIMAVLNVLKGYEDRQKPIYIDFLRINQLGSASEDGSRPLINDRRVSDMTEEELADYVIEGNNEVVFSANGPFGKFGLLEEVDLFEKASEAVPYASWTGYLGGDDQGVEAELKDGKLYLRYWYPDDVFEEEVFMDDEEDDDIIDGNDDEDWDDEAIYDPIAKEYLEPYDEDEN